MEKKETLDILEGMLEDYARDMERVNWNFYIGKQLNEWYSILCQECGQTPKPYKIFEK